LPAIAIDDTDFFGFEPEVVGDDDYQTALSVFGFHQSQRMSHLVDTLLRSTCRYSDIADIPQTSQLFQLSMDYEFNELDSA